LQSLLTRQKRSSTLTDASNGVSAPGSFGSSSCIRMNIRSGSGGFSTAPLAVTVEVIVTNEDILRVCGWAGEPFTPMTRFQFWQTTSVFSSFFGRTRLLTSPPHFLSLILSPGAGSGGCCGWLREITLRVLRTTLGFEILLATTVRKYLPAGGSKITKSVGPEFAWDCLRTACCNLSLSLVAQRSMTRNN
jgi:hypothetical protein